MTRSLVVTVLIFAAVWGGLLLVLDMPMARSPDHLATASDNATQNIYKDGSVQITGLQRNIEVFASSAPIEQLWEDFYQIESLHMRSDLDLSRVYVLYDWSGSDTQNAQVTIGYPMGEAHDDSNAATSRIELKHYDSIYTSHQTWDTNEAWEQLNDNDFPESVLEEFLLSPSGSVLSARVLIKKPATANDV
ncbi:MAG: hypothetical protein AAF353_01990 [Pseudomonadota bacterium]